MLNICLKVPIRKSWRSRTFDFLILKNFSPGQFLGSSNSRRYHWIFKTSCCNLKVRGLGVKLCPDFLFFFNFERNYDVLKSKNPCILLNRNINFNKNETESKLKNPTYRFREMNLVPQLIQKSQIKSKTMISWSSWKNFCTIYFVRGKFL